MKETRKIERYLKLQVTSADPALLISGLAEMGIAVHDVCGVDMLTVTFRIRKNDYASVKGYLNKEGAAHSIIGRNGLFWVLTTLRKRPVFVAGMAVLLLLWVTLPGRILFVSVEGSDTIPEKLLLEQADQCGIGFGSSRRQVRSEKVKNALLAMNPQLQWIGVNTSGCVATVRVKERSVAQQTEIIKNRVSSIVAVRDGVVSEIVTYEGTPLCQVGQNVSAGDILISGYTDCGIKVRAEAANGEVFAYTMRDFIFVSPTPTAQKEEILSQHTCIQLKIAKKVINLCNHSGIPGATCDKMYVEEYWTLPGGFKLPISVIRRTYTVRRIRQTETSGLQYSFDWMEEFADEFLRGQMIAGEVLSRKESLTINKDCGLLHGSYSCEEMIGQVKYEETIIQNAEDY